MPFPRAQVLARLNANVDDLLAALGGGAAQRNQFLDELLSPGASGNASPFLKALFPEVKIAAAIERSLNTALGRGRDHMVRDIAIAGHGNGESNYLVHGQIPVVVATMINDTVESYDSGKGHASPSTAQEIAAITAVINAPGPRETVREADDAFFVAADGTENHIEIKTPKPNYDQCKRSKRRILRITAARVAAGVPVKAFVAMPYNPNGMTGNYSWPVTKYFLDPGMDLMIGEAFWNYVGNSPDTYAELIDCFCDVGAARSAELRPLLSEV